MAKYPWIAAILFFTGCAATTSTMTLTPEEQTCLQKAKAFPLEFTIPKDQEAEAWGRAQSFLGRFSSMKLQTVTDFVIQTYNPPGSLRDFGYSVTKTPMGENVQFTVECFTGSAYREDAVINAHISAWYIATGELCSERLIMR